MRHPFACFALVLLCAAQAHAETASDKDIAIDIRISGESVHAAVSCSIEATPQEVWAVVTDFEHMAQFVSNLESSRIVSASEHTLLIVQKGKASFGPFTFSFDNTREIRLTPFTMVRSRLVSGRMKKMDGETRLAADGNLTRIDYQADSIPNFWIPPIIGRAFIEKEMRRQFQEMKNEILRRKRTAQIGESGETKSAADADVKKSTPP